MSNYEIISIGISFLALVLSAKSWFSSKDIGRKQLELQRSTSALAKKQLELLLIKESESVSAKLAFQAVKDGNRHKFILENTGKVLAKNVSFEFSPHGGGESPLVGAEYARKFPVPVLAPGSSVGVLAAVHLGSATAFEVKLCWEDPGGEQREESTFVSF